MICSIRARRLSVSSTSTATSRPSMTTSPSGRWRWRPPGVGARARGAARARRPTRARVPIEDVQAHVGDGGDVREHPGVRAPHRVVDAGERLPAPREPHEHRLADEQRSAASPARRAPTATEASAPRATSSPSSARAAAASPRTARRRSAAARGRAPSSAPCRRQSAAPGARRTVPRGASRSRSWPLTPKRDDGAIWPPPIDAHVLTGGSVRLERVSNVMKTELDRGPRTARPDAPRARPPRPAACRSRLHRSHY